MSIKLDRQALENIKNYKYKTHGLTFIERLIMDPFWNLVCKMLPEVRKPLTNDLMVDIGTKYNDDNGVNFPSDSPCRSLVLRLDIFRDFT